MALKIQVRKRDRKPITASEERDKNNLKRTI